MMTVSEAVDLMITGDDNKPARLALLNILKTPGYPSILGKMVCEHLYRLTGKSYIYLIGSPFETEALKRIHHIQTAWAEENSNDTVQADIIDSLPMLSQTTEPLVKKLLPWVVDGYSTMLEAKGLDASSIRKAAETSLRND